jgi:hypothetical protein
MEILSGYIFGRLIESLAISEMGLGANDPINLAILLLYFYRLVRKEKRRYMIGAEITI